MARADDEQETQQIRQQLKGCGLRATAARLAVLKRLRHARSPVTHAELAAALAPTGFDKATVFRNLADLTEVGLLSRTELGDRVWRFEIRDPTDPANDKHPHFVCTDCGQVHCLSDIEFDDQTVRRMQQVGRVTEILLKGQCQECAKGRSN